MCKYRPEWKKINHEYPKLENLPEEWKRVLIYVDQPSYRGIYIGSWSFTEGRNFDEKIPIESDYYVDWYIRDSEGEEIPSYWAELPDFPVMEEHETEANTCAS